MNVLLEIRRPDPRTIFHVMTNDCFAEDVEFVNLQFLEVSFYQMEKWYCFRRHLGTLLTGFQVVWHAQVLLDRDCLQFFRVSFFGQEVLCVMFMPDYIFWVNWKSHFMDHFWRIFRSDFKPDFIPFQILVLSANIFLLELTVNGKSFTCFRNSHGPKRERCGTPLTISTYSELHPSMITLISVKNFTVS